MTEIHPVRRDQLGALARLCHEHADYDRRFEPAIAPLPGDLTARLERMLFEEHSLHCQVAECDGRLHGYATGFVSPSTWRGDTYYCMDCLYVREGSRGGGLGRRLLEAMRETAETVGVPRFRWQTPLANDGSNRFYQRFGETYPLGHADKRVYTIDLAGG